MATHDNGGLGLYVVATVILSSLASALFCVWERARRRREVRAILRQYMPIHNEEARRHGASVLV
jgi:uncharacterized membrane-anchored protein